jgi:hypothetical protein
MDDSAFRRGARCQKRQRHADPDHHNTTGHNRQASDNEIHWGESSGEKQISATGVLISAGKAGRGEQRPSRDEDHDGGARSPHGEAAWIVKRDGRSEQDTDGRVVRQGTQHGPAQGVGERGLVLHGHDRGHSRRDHGHDQSATVSLTDSQPSDRVSGPGIHRKCGHGVVLP